MISFQQVFKDLDANLSAKCSSKIILTNVPTNPKYIKLYDRKNDAFEENERFNWYEITRIHQHNDSEARLSGILCHKCPKSDKCIISLRINKKTTRFAVVSNVQLSNTK